MVSTITPVTACWGLLETTVKKVGSYNWKSNLKCHKYVDDLLVSSVNSRWLDIGRSFLHVYGPRQSRGPQKCKTKRKNEANYMANHMEQEHDFLAGHSG